MLDDYPEYVHNKYLIYDSERYVFDKLNNLRIEKNKDYDSMMRTLENYYLIIGGDLNAFLS